MNSSVDRYSQKWEKIDGIMEFITLISMVTNSCSYYYPVDISTTIFSYSLAVQYHTILHGVLLHGQGLLSILATTVCFN